MKFWAVVVWAAAVKAERPHGVVCAAAAIRLYDAGVEVFEELRLHPRLPRVERFQQLVEEGRGAINACWAKHLDAELCQRCGAALHSLYFRVSLLRVAVETDETDLSRQVGAVCLAAISATAACLQPLLGGADKP